MKPHTQKLIEVLSDRIESGKYDEIVGRVSYGIRSRQVVALLDLLIELGILDIRESGGRLFNCRSTNTGVSIIPLEK